MHTVSSYQYLAFEQMTVLIAKPELIKRLNIVRNDSIWCFLESIRLPLKWFSMELIISFCSLLPCTFIYFSSSILRNQINFFFYYFNTDYIIHIQFKQNYAIFFCSISLRFVSNSNKLKWNKFKCFDEWMSHCVDFWYISTYSLWSNDLVAVSAVVCCPLAWCLCLCVYGYNDFWLSLHKAQSHTHTK